VFHGPPLGHSWGLQVLKAKILWSLGCVADKNMSEFCRMPTRKAEGGSMLEDWIKNYRV